MLHLREVLRLSKRPIFLRQVLDGDDLSMSGGDAGGCGGGHGYGGGGRGDAKGGSGDDSGSDDGAELEDSEVSRVRCG